MESQQPHAQTHNDAYPKHQPYRILPRKEVQNAGAPRRVRRVVGRVKAKWPHKEFREFAQERMRARGITSRAELSRASGVKEGQLSNWWNGKNQPTKELLARLAPALDTTLLSLQLKAGLIEPDEIDAPPDDTILPDAFKRALDAYKHAAAKRPDLVDELLAKVDYAAEWFEVASKRRPVKK